ncbi:cellulose biosynthesis cyclic di-GMP-binding regulatory protein BcsB [Oceaniglobus ichthyenteri]|uniref:cellulose biosynthesis cyclic di-GMP-binding regulatory protein BcsB n=1 Tax=Oceaniglobus ichthyenteri TaxID=2136177 RepID=UPI000D38FD36|nr:cellulose biosynthesis cyclic di-GMP-binding regulatory protein BcsB [Oceaniglobus ichthyenteri]
MTRWKTCFAAALLAAFVPLNWGAAQQIILEGVDEIQEPNRERVVPPVAPETSRAMHDIVPTPNPDLAPPATLTMPLRAKRPQIEATDRFRMQGQYGRAEFYLFLPADVGASTFQLTTKSAINVLPERSSIEVFVNDTSVGTIVPDHFEQNGIDTLDVPAGLLAAGRNTIVLAARQVHRVFCGPEAAFSLWTDIVLADSGITIDSADLETDTMGFFAATSAQLARGDPFSIHISGASFPLSEAAAIIARVEDIFGGTPPEIRFEDYYSVSSQPPQLARVTALPPDMDLPGGPAFYRGGDGAIVLLTNSGDYTDVGRVLLGVLKDQDKSAGAPLLNPGALTTLADLGVPLIEGQGRYFQAPVSFRLPRDWLLLASQQAELFLDYQFDTQLPTGSLLLVKINNTTIRLLPLDEVAQSGRPLRTLRVPFDANLLQPGVNRLTFEALIPGDPPDQACVLRDAPIFQVFGTTALSVPRSPSMSLPGISEVLAVLGPDSIRISEAARATVPLGILPQIGAVYANEPPADEAGTDRSRYELTVGVPGDLSRLAGDVVDGHNSDLQSVLLSTAREPVRDLDLWQGVDKRPWWHAFYDLEQAAALPSRVIGGLADMWRGPEQDLRTWLAGHSADAMLIQPDMSNPESIWLILRSRTDPVRIVSSLAATHQEFDGPHGQVALYSPENGWISWTSPDRPLSLNESLTLGNIRAVVGNYVTLTPAQYILPLFLLIFCSAMVGIGIAILSRRRKR